MSIQEANMAFNNLTNCSDVTFNNCSSLSDELSSLASLLNTSLYTDDNVTDNIYNGTTRRPIGVVMGIQIALYLIIFLLGVVGNVLVIVTLIQNQKMRTVTNVFLFNLALSDLLLVVFCMPFTLIPVIMQNFIFGEIMCILIRYLQGVSVAVSCFTLVAISLERYFAICRPLRSRQWQTLSHSYKVIVVCWVLAFALMWPIAAYQRLKTPGYGIYRCQEDWASIEWEKFYTIFLDCMLLVVPVIIMSFAYGMISYILWVGMKLEYQSEQEKRSNRAEYNHNSNGTGQPAISVMNEAEYPMNIQSTGSRPFRRFEQQRALRQSNSVRNRAVKKRLIKMLFAIVLEFFICWAPIYILYTWLIFDKEGVRRHVSGLAKSLIHLLSYVSSCCNPITYCFFNRNYRQAFIAAIRCFRKKRYIYAHKSEMSFSGNTNSTRTIASNAASYDKIQESDELSEKSL
ncbi:cholecystokinin receptor type A [Patella vulgata]|uniref:cholecystokinin receptor type A n=1 Tax=Patella vulgata TaxID=6465 RepID=UPI00218029A3|nr:cholecystokinin receptor type A [Patella vulgata]